MFDLKDLNAIIKFIDSYKEENPDHTIEEDVLLVYNKAVNYKKQLELQDLFRNKSLELTNQLKEIVKNAGGSEN